MQQRLNRSQKSRLLAALALAIGLTLTPVSALADDQVSDDEVQQEAIEEAGAESTTPSAVEEDLAATEAIPVEPSAHVVESDNTTNTDAAYGEDVASTSVASESTVTQTDATVDEAAGTATDAAGAAPSDADEATADNQLETAGDVDGAEAQPSTNSASDTESSLDASTSLKAQTASDQQSIPEGTYIIESGIVAADGNGLAKLVLHAKDGAHDGAEVITWNYTGSSDQKWRVSLVADAWYTIASLADESLVLTATQDNGKLYLTKHIEGLASQLWSFILSGTSYGTGYSLVPQGIQVSATDATIVESSQDKTLDVRNGKPTSGADLITYTKGSTFKPNQSFYLVDPAPQVSGGRTDLEGRYRVRVPDTHNVVEIKSASTANGANVWTYSANGKAHQDIYLQYEGNGFYSLWVIGTTKVLDVMGGSILPGTNIIQWTYSGKDNQLWAVRDNDNGTISFVNKGTGLVLGGASEKDGQYGSGTNIVGAQDNGRTNNDFILERMNLLTAGIYKFVRISDSSVVDVYGASTASGAKIDFFRDNGKMNQRFELVFAGDMDIWRIRTASSGGWITVNSSAQIVQQGNHSTAQGPLNTWRVVWRKGGYQFICDAGNRILGTSSAKFKMVKAPIALAEGLFEIDAKAAKVVLDNPGGSMTAGAKTIVYADKNGANQRFYVVKYGSGYKLINLVSDLALTASGSNVTQGKFTGSASQVWIAGIADGGYIRLINSSTMKALDISGSGTISQTGSTALSTSECAAGREARQSWKMVRMPLPIFEKLAQIAMHFADHNTHGYSRPNRGTGGNETITLRDGTKVTVSKSDIDCSEMVRQCINAAFGKQLISYMWTGNQRTCMKTAKFQLIAFDASKVKRGDILWRNGHTCIALGNGKTSEAFGSETHDIHGKRGDQTGNEVAYGTVGTNWTYIFRWVKTDA